MSVRQTTHPSTILPLPRGEDTDASKLVCVADVGEGVDKVRFSMLPEFVLDYWQFTTHYSLCFAYAKRPLIFVLFTGTSSVRFCFKFIQQKSLLICPANSLKFEQTFFRIT